MSSSPSTASSSASSSASTPIVLKRMKNIFEFGFGNEGGISTTSPMSPTSLSVILMKRKRNVNNNINNINNNIFSKCDDIDISPESIEVIPDDYYHRHRERKLEYQKNYNRENDDKIKDKILSFDSDCPRLSLARVLPFLDFEVEHSGFFQTSSLVIPLHSTYFKNTFSIHYFIL